MHKIEGANNVDGLFTEGPPPTTVPAAWLNTIQEEIVNAIEGAGITLKRQSNDTNDQLLATIQSFVSTAAIRDLHRNLIIKNGTNPDEQVDIDADELILQNTAGVPRRIPNINFTADNTGAGLNGLFTGAVAASTWYAIWIVSGTSGNGSGLHLSSDLATVLGDAPAGYNLFGAHVGWMLTDGASDWVLLSQVDNRVTIVGINALAAGSNVAYTLINLATIIPTTAKAVFGTLEGVVGSVSFEGFLASSSTGLGEVKIRDNIVAVAKTLGAPFIIPVITSQSIYYKRSGAGSTINVDIGGWEY